MARAWCHGCWRPVLTGADLESARAEHKAQWPGRRQIVEGESRAPHGEWWALRAGDYVSCDWRRPTLEGSSGEAIGLAALAREQARRRAPAS
jgi:hypothetical protein